MTIRVIWLFVAAALCASSGQGAVADRPYNRAMDDLPRRVLWAWERPEDMRGYTGAVAVAYLAATVRLHADGIEWMPRRQPLKVADDTQLVAVVRVESHGGWRPDLRANDVAVAAARLVSSARAPRVRALQIDFDATASQRAFYKNLIVETRRLLAPDMPLTITALASWCTETWLDELPIEEAVPMLFQMGDGAAAFRATAAGGRWAAKVCRGSLGLSTDEPQVAAGGRRVYTFNPAGWSRR
jgi:hypothetical protein